jgi:hypothetical protein
MSLDELQLTYTSYNGQNLNSLAVSVIRGSTVYIYTPTYYGLEGQGIETRWGRGFPHQYRPALWLTQSPVKWVPVLFPGGKVGGAWLRPSTQSSAEVKERVEQYLYPPSGPSWPVIAWTLHYMYHKALITVITLTCLHAERQVCLVWERVYRWALLFLCCVLLF